MVKVLFLLLMLFLANLAWISEKWLGLVAGEQGKHLWQRFVELIASYFIILGTAYLIERSVMGQVWKQDWEFYAVTFALFLVLSFPGFIYRMLWK